MKMHRYCAAFFASILFLSFSGCIKKAEENTQASVVPVDPRNDLIAATDPVNHILYVVPEEKDAVLKYLEATPASGGETYLITAVNFMRNRVPFMFRVQPATASQLLMQTADNKNKANLLFCSYQDDKAMRDTARGRFIGKLDTGGVCYRIYKNAKCVQVAKAYETDCIEEEITNADSTFSKTGRSYIIKSFEVSHCLKGTSMCVETLCVHNMKSYYNNGNCKGAPISVNSWDIDYNCTE